MSDMTFIEKEIIIQHRRFQLGATLTLPTSENRTPGILLAGGSMSHLRDGDLIADYSGPPRKAMRRLANSLAENGFASLRWDKLGFGESVLKEGPPHIQDHVDALHAALSFMAEHPDIDGSRLVIAGESAGAHYTTLLAKRGVEPLAYALLGALGSSVETLFEYNYGRTVRYAEQSAENLEWVEKAAVKAFVTGLHYPEMFRRAREGQHYYRMTYKTYSWDWHLPPLKEQLEQNILSLFSYLKRPVLIIQGEHDMNVPPTDAAMIEKQLVDSGNRHVVRIMIPNSDHNFQLTPDDEESRFRERISLKCVSNPYSPIFYEQLTAWFKCVIGNNGA